MEHVKCSHGLDLCPCRRSTPLVPAPSPSAVTDGELGVIEAAAALRNAKHAGDPTDVLLARLCERVDALDGLFADVR